MLGAAIVLPDHPQIAPESRGGLFDSTEIEEALLLHVQALSDAEREEIARAATRRCARWSRAPRRRRPRTSSRLHGRVTLRDPRRPSRRRAPPGLADPRAGEPRPSVDGVTFRRGDKVVHPARARRRPARRGCSTAARATIERIFIDYDGKTHLGVTIDDDPGQELMRETGRFLFFFAAEVEVIDR